MVNTIREIEQEKSRKAYRRFRNIAGGGHSGVRPFAFQGETEALIAHANFGAAPSTNLKRTIDRAIKRLKAANLWNDIRFVNPVGATTDASLTNWVNPAEKALIVGAPTFTANVGWVGVTTTGYINTGIVANTLNQNNLSVYVWSQTTTVSSNNDCGCTNGASEGITIATRRAVDDNIGMRLCGAFDQVSPIGDGDGYGLNGGSRYDASNVTGHRNGVMKSSVVRASAALPALPIFFLTNNGNGSPATVSPRQLAFLLILNRGITEAEHRTLTGIFGEYLDTIASGLHYVEEVAVGTKTITAQCIGYGLTVPAILYCLQAARQGKTVALCGGWRDRWNYGGVSGGGLGFVDFNTLAALGGLPRYVIRRCNLIEGVADTSFVFRSKNLLKVMKELLDPTKNGGFTIPVYQTRGISKITKTGTVINSFVTTDGRTFNGSQFFDGSYEGDLMRMAGVGFTKGREAAGSGLEANNGVQLSATDLAFQPFFTANTPASGLIPHVHRIRSTFTPALDTVGPDGTADTHIQAYNFRLTFTNVPARRVPLPTTPPAGYAESDYEFLFRFLAATPAIDTFPELFKEDAIYGNTFDVNNENFISSDFVGNADAYPLASYATRETLWKLTWNYLMGFLYACQYGVDARIPAALKTSMASWGFLQDHYYAPHENDNIFENPQMYIRETVRMIGSQVLNGNDLNAVDGTVPRISTNIISMISYNTDSHAVQRVAHEVSAGNWSTKNEGGLGIATGGVDGNTPVPIEIVIPKVGECTNLAVSFCASTTHVGFGAYRMEPTMWQVGQSMGLAASLAIDGDNIIQNVNYGTLRTALLASASLVGEVAPVLTQVN